MSGSRGSERRGGGPACPALRAIAGTRALRRGCRKALGALGQRATALPKAPAAAGSQSGSDATVQAAVTVHWIPRSLKVQLTGFVDGPSMWRVREEGGSAVRTGDSLGRADSRVGRLRMLVLDQLTRRCHEATE